MLVEKAVFTDAVQAPADEVVFGLEGAESRLLAT